MKIYFYLSCNQTVKKIQNCSMTNNNEQLSIMERTYQRNGNVNKTCPSVQQQFSLLHVSEHFDPEIFRKTVQAKIKEKYFLNKWRNGAEGVREVSLQPAVGKRKKKGKEISGKHHEKKHLQTQHLPRFPKNGKRVSSLQQFIDSKNQSFITTSNLFSGVPSILMRERKTNPTRLEGLSKYQPKQKEKSKIGEDQKMSSLNFGYGMDGSIFHFEEGGTKTVPDEVVEMDILKKPRGKRKEDIYKYLKNTSPLNIRQQVIQDKRAMQTITKREKIFPSKLTPSNVNSLSLQKCYLQTNFSPLTLQKKQREIKKRQHPLLWKDKQELTGWQHDDQF